MTLPMRHERQKAQVALAVLWRLVAMAGVTLLLASCAIGGGNSLNPPSLEANGNGGPEKRPASGRAVKVGLLLPLTGPGNSSAVARGLKQAAELALFDFDNPNVQLVTRDTKGTLEGARAAAQAAVEAGAELIIGPLFAQSVQGAASIARQAGVPVIAFSTDRSVAGNGVYLLSFLAGRDVPRIVDFAAMRGKRRFAALVPEGEYGKLVEDAYRQAVSARGGTVVAVERYPGDANGMLEPARKIAALAVGTEAKIDALLIPANKTSLPTLAQLMPYFEIDTQRVQLLGTGQWDYPNVGREKALAGAWFPAPDPKAWKAFTQRYAQTFDQVPPRLASLAYDAVSLAIALSNNERGQRFTAQQITRPNGFAGIDGLFRLRADGTPERGLAVLEVQPFGARVLDQAPNTFASAALQRPQPPPLR